MRSALDCSTNACSLCLRDCRGQQVPEIGASNAHAGTHHTDRHDGTLTLFGRALDHCSFFWQNYTRGAHSPVCGSRVAGYAAASHRQRCFQRALRGCCRLQRTLRYALSSALQRAVSQRAVRAAVPAAAAAAAGAGGAAAHPGGPPRRGLRAAAQPRACGGIQRRHGVIERPLFRPCPRHL